MKDRHIHQVTVHNTSRWMARLIVVFTASVGPAQTRTIHADAGKPVGRHTEVPLMSVGGGHAADGLRADWQEHLSVVQREIGFRYLRFHGILDDDMGVYTEDASGEPVYRFEKLDRLYDALLARHIKPFVELSFMPSALARGSRTIFAYKTNITPPKDMARWQALIRALVGHCVGRYGAAEVETWYFEVWNEPDSPGFFAGSMEEYQALYRATALSLKEVCGRCRVGGPAILTPFVGPFLSFLRASGTPADFLSLHAYGVTRVAADAQGRPGAPLDGSALAVVRTVRAARLVTDRSELPELPVHLTEWSASYFPDDPFHDQYGAASFVLSRVRGSAPYAASMAYWTFTDVLSERDLPPDAPPFTGGFGLLTRGGIRKPSFFAYKYMAALGSTDLATDDVGESWVTESPGRRGPSVQALFWDYSPAVPPAGQIDQTFYRREIPAVAAAPVELTIDHLPGLRYRLQVFRTGHGESDAYTAYLRTGSATEPNGAAVETRDVRVDAGRFQGRFAMNQNDVYLVTLTPR